MNLKSLFLAAALVFTMAAPASAASDTASGVCGDSAKWSLSDDGTLTISGRGAMYDYRNNGSFAPWHDLTGEIRSVVISEGITHVGTFSFLRCMQMQSAKLPESVTSIGRSAFSNCSTLSDIDLPDGLTELGPAAFWYCQSLTEIDIPAGVTSLEMGTFNRCDSLVSVNLPAGLKAIEERAFNECYALENITLPGGLTFIGMDAFSYCRALPSVVIPDTVTRMDSWAFNHCEVMTSAVVGSGITDLDESVFRKCYLLTDLDIRGQVTDIGTEAFASCSSLERIALPASVETIDISAFADCDALKAVDFGGTEAQWKAIDIESDNDPLKAAALTCAGPELTPFDDVADGAWYAPSVEWAVKGGITNGTGYRTFSPDMTCTRAQILTFLYRANGSPAPGLTAAAPEDCDPTDWYASAVLWSAANSLFDGPYAYPAAPCTRGMAVDFLYRLAGSPPVNTSHRTFTDVPENLVPAVEWAVEKGITNGTDITHFSPDMTCTRGTIVTLLHRAARH